MNTNLIKVLGDSWDMQFIRKDKSIDIKLETDSVVILTKELKLEFH